MALYFVERTDAVGPGEFVNAYVIASGTAQARNAVASAPGVTKKNLHAERQETSGYVQLLASYYDESPTLDDALEEGPATLPMTGDEMTSARHL